MKIKIYYHNNTLKNNVMKLNKSKQKVEFQKNRLMSDLKESEKPQAITMLKLLEMTHRKNPDAMGIKDTFASLRNEFKTMQ